MGAGRVREEWEKTWKAPKKNACRMVGRREGEVAWMEQCNGEKLGCNGICVTKKFPLSVRGELTNVYQPIGTEIVS